MATIGVGLSGRLKEEEKGMSGTKRLVDLKVREVSLVDVPAIQREFLVVKRKEEGCSEVLEEDVEGIKALHKNYIAEEVDQLDARISDLSSDLRCAIGYAAEVLKAHRSSLQPCTKEDDYVEAVVALLEKAHRSQDEGEEMFNKAVWSQAFINDLPDSAFLWIAPGGKKDEEGKTVPRSLRFFPVFDDKGELDLPHLRNAIARIPQAKHPALTDAVKERLQEKARKLLEEAKKEEQMSKADQTVLAELVSKLSRVLENFDGSLVADAGAATGENTLEERNVTKEGEAKQPEITEEEVAKSEAAEPEKGGQEPAAADSSSEEASDDAAQDAESSEEDAKQPEEGAPAQAADSESESKAEESKEEEPEEMKKAASPEAEQNFAWVENLAEKLKKSIEESLGSKLSEEIAKATKPLTEKVEALEKSTKPLSEKVEQIEKARLPSTSVASEGGNDDAVKQVKKGLWDGIL